MKPINTIMLIIFRILVSLLFIYSGWIKAIDPMGSAHKVAEYFNAVDISISENLSIFFAVVLCAVELFLGLMLLFKLWERVVSAVITAVMLGFTIVSLVLLIFPSLNIEDCGCFGDAFEISIGVTFAKNILLLTMSSLYTLSVWRRYIAMQGGSNSIKEAIFKSVDCKLHPMRLGLYTYIAIVSISIPLYSILYLPPFTYMPYDIGENLREINNPSEEGETVLVYKNIKTGKEQTFDINSTEWHDSDKWEYVDTKTLVDGKEVSGDDTISFSLYNANGDNVTDNVVNADGYLFMIVSEKIESLTQNEVSELQSIIDMNFAGQVDAIIATSTPIIDSREYINHKLDGKLNDFEIYNLDNTLLKALLRDSAGVILIKDGVIIAKWNSRQNSVSNIAHNKLGELPKIHQSRVVTYFSVACMLGVIMIVMVVLYHRKK